MKDFSQEKKKKLKNPVCNYLYNEPGELCVIGRVQVNIIMSNAAISELGKVNTLLLFSRKKKP